MGKDSNEETSYQPVNLFFTSYLTTESPEIDKPPIIFVPGLFTTNNTWNRVKCQISNRTKRRVYSLDLRNHGKSVHSKEFSVGHMAADLEKFMQEQDIPKAILIGHSCGGRIVMEIALHKPELVEQLVAEDILISDNHLDKRKCLVNMCKQAQWYISQLPPTMSEADARKVLNNIINKFMPQLSHKGRVPSDVGKAIPIYKDSRTGDFKLDCNLPVLIDFLEDPAKARVNLSADLIYQGPTLFISGEHTFMNMQEEKDLALKHFPHAQFKTLKNCFHVSHSENPEEFIRKVSDFILSSSS